VLLCLLPFSTCRHYWHEHDRSAFFVARDFAYNMLTPLKPNAILFTNGDNDTFPLWYLQQVEGIRKDVQVANLSLLNTDWYIRQLRDQKPSVDFGWSDPQVEDVEFFSTAMTGYRMGMISREQFERFLQDAGLRPYVRSLDQPLLAKDIAVARIVERERDQRPIYLALTVPDQMGLEKSLVQKGIAFELESASSIPERVDAAETVRLLRDVYLFRGLLGPDGKHDYRVYKDENAGRLVQNYSAAAIAAAQELRAQGDFEASDEMVTLGLELTPGSLPVLYSLAILKLDQRDWAGAEQVIRSLLDDGVNDGRLHRLLGRSYEGQDRLDEAEAQYRRSLELSPGSFESMRDLFSLYWVIKGDKPGGLAVLDEWLRLHPDDRVVREARRVYGDSLGL
jgi:tetratricopeptide (TPR) repeat protein